MEVSSVVSCLQEYNGGYPKLGVPFLGVVIIRTIVYWGLCWGTLILGNYHVALVCILQLRKLK